MYYIHNCLQLFSGNCIVIDRPCGTDRRQLMALIGRYPELTGMLNKKNTAALQMLDSTWTNQLSHVEVWVP